jgi:chromosome transmission fidelity protein 18
LSDDRGSPIGIAHADPQVNANIVKPAEKALLARLVELMIPLNLSFFVEKSESGQPMMRLEPYVLYLAHDISHAGEGCVSWRGMRVVRVADR